MERRYYREEKVREDERRRNVCPSILLTVWCPSNLFFHLFLVLDFTSKISSQNFHFLLFTDSFFSLSIPSSSSLYQFLLLLSFNSFLSEFNKIVHLLSFPISFLSSFRCSKHGHEGKFGGSGRNVKITRMKWCEEVTEIESKRMKWRKNRSQ